jgi:hypothetical protein
VDLGTVARRARQDAERWEAYANMLALKNNELQLAIAARDELANWLSDRVLACTKLIDSQDNELGFLRGQVNNMADAYTAERSAHNNLKAAHRTLKTHYAVANAESKRVRELQKLADEKPFVRKSKSDARKRIKRSADELFSEK